MKFFFKFLGSAFTLPFIIPWYLGDKAFEYLFQPAIFRKYNVDVAPGKARFRRIALLLAVLLPPAYAIRSLYKSYSIAPDGSGFLQYFKVAALLGYNDLAKTVNTIAWPLNRALYYFGGGYIDLWDFFISFYLCLVPPIFLFSIVFRLSTTRRIINRAAELRNNAVRDVDIVHFAESAREDEVFFGLDLNRENRPFYMKRNWLKGHMQVVGGPGSGKTESIIQPLWYQAVRRNIATIVLDGKASKRNVDKFFTIASSLAQGQDIYYFNPADPARSGTYNPLLNGSVTEVKQKIMASMNWSDYPAAQRERLDAVLDIFLNAMEEKHEHFSLRGLMRFFQSRDYLIEQTSWIKDDYTLRGLQEIAADYPRFQSELAFFMRLLRNLFQSEYGQLLNAKHPTIDITDIYLAHKDCYFTLPLQTDDATGRFVGQLIQQDIIHAFRQIALKSSYYTAEEGLFIIDEMAKFAGPDFIRLLQACQTVGVSVCYTNQSLAELDTPGLNSASSFANQLADHTNTVCCFQLGSSDGIQSMLKHFGEEQPPVTEEHTPPAAFNAADPNVLRHLEVGRCIVFVRRPRLLTVLKTGYFKFEELMTFSGDGTDVPEEAGLTAEKPVPGLTT